MARLAGSMVVLRILLAFAFIGVMTAAPEGVRLQAALGVVGASGLAAAVGVLAARRWGLSTVGQLLWPSAGGFFHLTVYFSLAVPLVPSCAGGAGCVLFPLTIPVLMLVSEIGNSAVRVFSRMQDARPSAAFLPEMQGAVQWACAAGALVISLRKETHTALLCGWAAAAVSVALATVFLCLNRAILKRSLRRKPAGT